MNMLSMIKRFFQEGKGKALKDRVDASMATKFMLAVTAVICVFMSIGTLLIIIMLMRGENRAIEARGRDMGQLLGKAVTEPLYSQDKNAVDGLVAEAVKCDRCIKRGPEQRGGQFQPVACRDG
jgi:hypothetical protein